MQKRVVHYLFWGKKWYFDKTNQEFNRQHQIHVVPDSQDMSMVNWLKNHQLLQSDTLKNHNLRL